MSAAILAIIAALAGLDRPQIGYLWTFRELTDKADAIVIAEPRQTTAARRTDHPDFQPRLPVLELTTTLAILSVIKPVQAATGAIGSELRLLHYRVDLEEWRRMRPAKPDEPPAGLVNAGSTLRFEDDKGPYLLFLKRAGDDRYEPLSGHVFPTDSVFLLGKLPARVTPAR